MMALKIETGIQYHPLKVACYGPEGIGKSTFAAHFPEPLFIDTEGSTRFLNVKRLPRPASWQELGAMVDEVARTPGVCQTLVIDTIDWAERLCTESVCREGKVKSIEGFGYGKGYVFVKEEFGRLLDKLSALTDKGVTVLLLAHSTIRKFERPDESGAYDRYELKLGGKAGGQVSALVKEWCDMLLFVNYEEMVVEGENKKKRAYGGKRIMHTQHHPAWDAKNRFDLPPTMSFEYDGIAFAVEAYKPIPPAETPAPSPVEETPDPLADADAMPAELAEFMLKDKVSMVELRQAVEAKGYFPPGTPFSQYPPDFVNQCLVGAWPQVLKVINECVRVPFK